MGGHDHTDLREAVASDFVMTVRVREAGAEVSLDHPLGKDAWTNARAAMEAAHAELGRLLSLQGDCPARPATLSGGGEAETPGWLRDACEHECPFRDHLEEQHRRAAALSRKEAGNG